MKMKIRERGILLLVPSLALAGFACWSHMSDLRLRADLADLKKNSITLRSDQARERIRECNFLPTAVTGFWEPTKTDVDKLLISLNDYFEHRGLPSSFTPLSGYHLQFAGFMSEGKRMIRVLACSKASFSDWKSKPVDVCKECQPYFIIDYNASTERCQNGLFSESIGERG